MNLRWLFVLLLSVASGTATAQAVGTWSNTGPVQFPVNVSGQVHGMGRVSQLKFHVSNPAKMYAVSASGGLFISNDTGVSWTPTPGTEVLPTTGCSSVCIDYTNDNIMYLSTGDQNYYGDWYGIYKTIDGGVTWTPSNVNIGNRMAVEIIMDPLNHNTLIAATTDGIWRSTNAGASWTQTFTGSAFKSMQRRPGSNNVLYASTGTKFYRSTNMGATWTNITAGVVMPTGNDGTRIAVTPADSNLVFIGTTDGYGQILKSTNGGTSFTNIYSSTTQCLVCYDSTVTSGSQGYYNFNLTVNPANPLELLLVSHCVWRSTDGGYTWSWRTQWYDQVHTDMHEILFDPYNLGLRFNANDGGVWLSRDPQATVWETRSNGLAATEMYHAAQSPVNRQMISAGTQDNGELFFDGIWKTNRGGDWGAKCGIDYLGSNTVYYNNGQRRNLQPLGGDYSYNAPFTTTPEFNIEFLPSAPNTAFIGTDSVWRSNDINNALPSWLFLGTLNENIMGMASCRADNNILYVVTDNDHLLRYDNAMSGAPTYITLATPAGTGIRASVATNKYNANVVYLTCGTTIYRSGNKGVTWTNITGALPSLNILKVIADDYSTTERLFVCLGNYVYYKDNTTTTWTLTAGLPTVMSINDFMVYNDSTSASIVRVGTYGRGSWECNILNNLPPTGTFASDKQNICPGDTVRYHKNLYGNYTSFTWLFPGGSPASSTVDSPVVVYTNNGNYNATLLVTGPGGTDTVTIPNYIHVSNGIVATISEGFEAATFPPAGWQHQSASGTQWQQTSAAGGFGTSTRSMLFDNFNNDAGGRKDRIILPKIDLTAATAAYLKFDVAYAYYPGYRDTLLVELSTDCGKTYSTIYLKDTSYLATAPNNTTSFVPAATEWRTDSISLNSYIGGGVQLCFTNKGHYGQNVYIDNVNLNVTWSPTIGVNTIGKASKIAVYPNPAKDRIFIKADGLSGNNVTVTCYNSVGQSMLTRKEALNNGQVNTSFDIASLPRGIYEVRVQSDSGEGYVEKVVLQ